MNPKRYAVVKIGNTNEIGLRMVVARGAGLAYVQRSKETEWHGDFDDECQVYWCEDEGSQTQLMADLTRRFPDNSYAKMTTTEVVYVPRAEPQRARFTDAGLVPA